MKSVVLASLILLHGATQCQHDIDVQFQPVLRGAGSGITWTDDVFELRWELAWPPGYPLGTPEYAEIGFHVGGEQLDCFEPFRYDPDRWFDFAISGYDVVDQRTWLDFYYSLTPSGSPFFGGGYCAEDCTGAPWRGYTYLHHPHADTEDAPLPALTLGPGFLVKHRGDLPGCTPPPGECGPAIEFVPDWYYNTHRITGDEHPEADGECYWNSFVPEDDPLHQVCEGLWQDLGVAVAHPRVQVCSM